MDILSFQEGIRCAAAPLDEAPLARALEMLWQAHRYAARAGMDHWEFAIEIDEFRRVDICNSELRWLLSQGYAAHANETASKDGRRRFRRAPCASLSDMSCFIIAEAGIALVESLEVAVLSSKFEAQLSLKRTSKAVGGVKRRSTVGAKPTWDAQRRELWVDGRMVKRLRQPSSNQQVILDAFEATHWPKKIINPLPLVSAQCPKRRLHDAVKCLNRYHRHQAIRFSGDGSGRGILWERID